MAAEDFLTGFFDQFAAQVSAFHQALRELILAERISDAGESGSG